MPPDPLVAPPPRGLPPGLPAPVDRRDPRLCTAHLSDGSGRTCSNFAIIGGTKCHAHGGSAPQVRAAAGRRVAQAALERDVSLVLQDLEVELHHRNPLDGLRDALARIGARVVAYSSVDPGPLTSERAVLLDELLRRWLTLQMKASKLAIDADLDTRYFELSEAAGRYIFEALGSGFDACFGHIRDELAARADFHDLFQGEPPGQFDRICQAARTKFIEAVKLRVADRQRPAA